MVVSQGAFRRELISAQADLRWEERWISGTLVPVCRGEFWQARQRGGHRLHEISYRACYKPALPAYFIERFSRPGDLIYDPFLGRGTTAIEAVLRGRRAAGNDINPLSRILTAPRLQPPALEAVEQRLCEVTLDENRLPAAAEEEDLLVFYHPRTLAEILSWREYFRQRQHSHQFDRVDAWLQMVACNRLTGHSAGFFSVYTLPPNQATSVTGQRRINRTRDQTPPVRDTKAILLKKSRQLLSQPLPKGYGHGHHCLLSESADNTPQIADASVSLVVTSPPFLDTVDYLGDNWLRLWFTGTAVPAGKLWQLRSLGDWVERMTAVLVELRRVLRPGGVIAFEVGEVRKGNLNLEDEVAAAGQAAGLDPQLIIIHSQNFTKTANCWGVDNNQRGTNSNRIVLFSKSIAEQVVGLR